MSQIGNKFFPVLNVPASVETVFWDFVLQGLGGAYYQPTEIKIWSQTGCSRFLVICYINGSGGVFTQVDGQWADPRTGIVDITTIANAILMGNGSDLHITGMHWDTGVLHNFSNTLVGQGNSG
jgi:hypothetical protein